MDKNKIFIGIDLGGTKIMTGAINIKGKVLSLPVKVATEGNDTAENIMKRITDSVDKVIRDLNLTINDVNGIGIGSTGPLDIKTGQILECPQLPNMHFFNLADAVRGYFRVPIKINNDANCFMLGESIFGAASNIKSVAGFTLGTGIGCAIVHDKKIWNGTGTAGEIWTSPYKDGNIEDFVSGAGVTKIYKTISGIEKSPIDVYKLACDNNSEAIQTWKEFGEHLAVPLSWTINIVDPEVVVLGGSITAAYPFFQNAMEEKLKKFICPVPAQKTKIVLAQLGDYAGFIGAACLMLDS